MNRKNGRRVFVFEETKQDVRRAATYGEIVYLFGASRQRSALFECDAVSDEIVTALEEYGFNPALDFVCVTGHIVSIALLTAAVVSNWGRVKFLLYDAIQKTYHERALGYEFEEI